ncbi:hypothetical protein DFR50_115111 [Roseiarcus fermentans]|uniref:Uncharacterized protein n=1 Tax=Roseiarcus fermentans TaxID=1473586 RepID=A0A366FBF3_9HYPH|nr:hypothetical protein [Roseiarcus fermentans]RBP12004.1 hypothetical protein DFR50_115111 [Roseiarcus fermentans]
MRLEDIVQTRPLSNRVLAFAAPQANDNLSFAERVKAEIAQAARAVGESYSQRELAGFATDASAVLQSLRVRLAARPT